MNQWQEVKLGVIVESISETFKFTDKPVVFLNTSDILANKFLHSDLSDPKTLPGQAKKKIQKGDLLFSEIRPANKRYALVDFDADDYVVSTKLMVLRSKGNIDPTFLKLFLTSEETLNYLQIIAEDRSGTFPQITFDILDQMDLMVPPREEQKVIASVLSSLDDKIDLLHRQNTTLEAMAETLFRQWFVEEAQEGWAEYKISDFADHLKQGVNPAQNPFVEYHHYSLPAFDENQRPVFEVGSEILSNKYRVLENTILVSKLNPRFPRIWPIQKLPSTNAVCSTEFQVFKPKQDNLYAYLYFLFGSSQARDALEMAASGTSGSHQRVRPEDMLNITTELPSIAKALEFAEITQSSIDKVTANRKQIQMLEKLRDNLLPKLMSGDVRVS